MVAWGLSLWDASLVCLISPQTGWGRRVARYSQSLGVATSLGVFDPWSVFDQATHLIVDRHDEWGVLGRLAGIEVSAWDENFSSSASKGFLSALSPEQLVQALLIDGAAYVDPYDGAPASCEAVIDILADWRRLFIANRDISCCLGVTSWKHRRMRQFLFRGDREVSFHRSTRAAMAEARRLGGGVAIWPSRAPTDVERVAAETGVPLVRLEDGFVRSSGLGSDLYPPGSIVVDRKGIYYDPSKPSDLETLLLETDFSPALLERAQALISTLIQGDITKYNVRADAAFDYEPGRKIVLAPGQVEDDQSVKLGGAGVAGNLDFLARVREREPDAYIVYKPHPDVEGGHRKGAIRDRDALKFADRLARNTSLTTLLRTASVVHTLSSLAGFETLLRGRSVVVHGQPFYSGWGLTEDLAPITRRNRRLSLNQLVAGVLILYPRYVDPVSGLSCSPELMIKRLRRAPRAPSTLQLLTILLGRARRLVAQARGAV
jgi:capsular polysaccharide export protein